MPSYNLGKTSCSHMHPCMPTAYIPTSVTIFPRMCLFWPGVGLDKERRQQLGLLMANRSKVRSLKLLLVKNAFAKSSRNGRSIVFITNPLKSRWHPFLWSVPCHNSINFDTTYFYRKFRLCLQTEIYVAVRCFQGPVVGLFSPMWIMRNVWSN